MITGKTEQIIFFCLINKKLGVSIILSIKINKYCKIYKSSIFTELVTQHNSFTKQLYKINFIIKKKIK